MGKKNAGQILLVEDDHNLGFLLQEYLESEGFDVSLFRDGDQAMKAYKTRSFDLCILDVMLPKSDGFTLANQIRSQDDITPIIFLTAKSLKEDKMQGFRIGADDYITKPFDEEELVYRINAILKRTSIEKGKQAETTFKIGLYTFDYPNQLLVGDGDNRKMTVKESEVLRLLCLHKNQILKREKALVAIYGESDYFYGRSFDVFITKLRKYLKADTTIQIENIHGVGFRLSDKHQ